MISISGFIGQLFAILLALALAPLLTGWVNQCRAWLQSRSAPPLLQPYYMLHKLFQKDVVLAHNASSLFRTAPFVIFGCMLLACAIIPSLSTDLPFAPAADTLALVGVFGLARIFVSLAAMDVGTSFGSLGGRREMLVGFLAEPALLMVIFTTAMISQSTSVATIVETLAHRDFIIYPSLAFAGIAFTMVSLAENARVPVDNPATHLELTMIHEVMVLDHSGPDLALLQYAGALKTALLGALVVRVSASGLPLPPALALALMVPGLAAYAIGIGVVESGVARFRMQRVPQLVVAAAAVAGFGLILLLR